MQLYAFADFCLWIPLTVYYFAVFPQVIKNFYSKSTDGMSTHSLFMFHIALMLVQPYVYFLRLPLAYRVICPLQGITSAVMVLQFFYYHKSPTTYWRKVIVLTWLTTGALFITGQWYPTAIGNLAGWTGVGMMALYQLPQIHLISRRRSTEGFSKAWVLFNVLGALIEITIGYLLQVPLQTVFSAFRRLSLNGMQLYQFYRYK